MAVNSKLIEVDQFCANVKILRLNDPTSLNAMSEQMAVEFKEAIDQIALDQTLRGLVIIGCGRAFSAGGDLQMLKAKAALGFEENKRKMIEFYERFLSIRKLEIPVVALINGVAVGAGLCLACACDIRFCSEQAKLGFSFGKIGLHPGMGATYFLAKLVGQAKAAELLLSGETIKAKQAYEIGLVNKVSPELELFKTAEKFFASVNDAGKLATKQLVQTIRSDGADLKIALEREAICQAENYASQEFSEKIQAAIDRKR